MRDGEPEARDHLGAELLRGRVAAGALHGLRQHPADVHLVGAVDAVRQVLGDVGVLGTLELVVQVLLEILLGLLAAAVRHRSQAPFLAGAVRRDTAPIAIPRSCA